MKKTVRRITFKALEAGQKAKALALDKRGEGYIDTAIKILIAVVIGALLLAGLYMLFKDTVLPTLTQRITDMFNYSG